MRNTNLNLHRRSIDLETALQKVETLLTERAEQIWELEEVPKIPVLPDEQLEMEHRMVMEASSNIVSFLALEDRCYASNIVHAPCICKLFI